MAKILLYMYLDINVGDDCMIRLFLSKFPEHEFYLHTRNLDYAALLGDVPNLTIVNNKLSIKALKAEGRQYDYFAMIGGSFFTTKPIGRAPEELKRTMLFRYLKKQGTTCAVIGCNITESITEWYQKPIVKRIVRDMSLFSVRDRFSYEVFAPYVKQKLTCFPDLVYAYDAHKLPAPHRAQNCLGVSAYRASSSAANTAYTVATVKALAQLCDAYCSRSPGHTVKLFAFDTAHENDTYAALQIYKQMTHKAQAEMVLYDGDIDNVIEKMNGCSVFLPIRFHAVVLSVLLKIPFIPVAYANKTENMLQDMGYTGTIYKWKELTEGKAMTTLLDDLDREQQRPTVFDLEDLRTRAKGHFESFRQMIEDSAAL